MTERDYVFVPLNRFDLVMEIISVAELYINDPHEPKTSAEASRLIKRAKKWIGPVKVSKVAPVVKKHSAFAQKQYARRVAKRKLKEGE